MSLYNMLFGVNPAATLLLRLLGLTPGDVPRFRDCYLTAEGTQIAIHTRTGGGNREGYADENDALAAHVNYLRDADDDFDCTYATFYFSVPRAAEPVMAALVALGADREKLPREKWTTMLDALRKNEQTPESARALEVGKAIFDEVFRALDAPRPDDVPPTPHPTAPGTPPSGTQKE